MKKDEVKLGDKVSYKYDMPFHQTKQITVYGTVVGIRDNESDYPFLDIRFLCFIDKPPFRMTLPKKDIIGVSCATKYIPIEDKLKEMGL